MMVAKWDVALVARIYNNFEVESQSMKMGCVEWITVNAEFVSTCNVVYHIYL